MKKIKTVWKIVISVVVSLFVGFIGGGLVQWKIDDKHIDKQRSQMIEMAAGLTGYKIGYTNACKVIVELMETHPECTDYLMETESWYDYIKFVYNVSEWESDDHQFTIE